MKQDKKCWILSVVLVMATAGCGYVPQGDTVDISFSGSVDATEDGFQMDGEITTGGGAPDREVYRGVSINLYNQDGELLKSSLIGDLETDGVLEVSLSSDKVPEYITIESTEFWEDDVEVDYFERMDGDYAIREATSEDDLPVKPSE